MDLEFSSFLFNFGASIPNWIVVFFATYLIWIIGILVFFIIYKKSSNPIRSLLFLIITVALAYAINFLIGYLFFRERPFESLGFNPLIDVSYPKKSFPSDHSAIAWSASMYVFLRYKKIAYFLIALAFFVSIGRVLAGVHYLSDVFAGFVIGLISVLVIYILEKRFKI